MSPIVPPVRHGTPKLLIPGAVVFVLMVVWVRYAERPPEPEAGSTAPAAASTAQRVTGAAEIGNIKGVHAAYPAGTRLRVTNPANGRSTVVTVEAAYEPHEGYVIRLPRSAASELGLTAAGPAKVTLERIP